MNLVKHKIDFTTKQPIWVKPFPIAYAKDMIVMMKYERLYANVIELKYSDYNSPIVMVKKKRIKSI